MLKRRAAGPTGCPSISSSSLSVSRDASGSHCACTSRAGAVKTIFPPSLPLNLSKSATVSIEASTASAVTGPLVPGVQAFGYAMMGQRLA